MDTLFRALVQHSSDAIVTLDAAGAVLFASESSARLLGFTPDEQRACRRFECLHPDDVASARAKFAECLDRPGCVVRGEYRVRHKDGSWRHIEALAVNRLNDPAVAAIVVNYRDVTDQHLAVDALRKSEARYRSLIQGAAYGIYRTTVEGRILDANPAIAAMLGYTVDELMAMDMAALYRSPDERAALVERYRHAHNQALTADVTWQKKDGTPIIVHLTARVVDVEDGVSCFEVVAEDITEKRALEAQLRQAQKMEAVGRLARGVAHDFNNVLAAIIGCSDLIGLRLKPGDPWFDDIQEIRRAAERGAGLTRQLLAFSRKQMLEAQLVDLNVVVAHCHSLMQRLAGERTPVRIITGSDPTTVRIEPGQLEQMLMNLVVNARDAMPNGGAIDVRVERITFGERAVLRYPDLTGGTFARIAVSDTGVGIPIDMQPHVFEPFFTTKDPAKGTGLGLSIVYGIAKEAGGTVSFSTAPNEGTTFEVLLPLVESRG
jgi:two-component system cell cycle sensor histidine kinase/response regulator CckA